MNDLNETLKHFLAGETELTLAVRVVSAKATDKVPTQVPLVDAPEVPERTSDYIEGWPVGMTAPEKPMAGIFYGIAKYPGRDGGNSTLATHQAREITVPRAKRITHVVIQNRAATDHDVQTRKEPVYQRCKKDKLTGWQCSLAYPQNWYQVGRVKLVVQLWAKGGDGMPTSGVKLTETAEYDMTTDYNAGDIELAFKTSILPDEGASYWLVFHNNNPYPNGSKLSGMYSIESARRLNAIPQEGGAFSQNGTTMSAKASQACGRYGPYHGERARQMIKVWDNSEWQESGSGEGNHSPCWYALKQEDGIYIGDAYSAIGTKGDIGTQIGTQAEGGRLKLTTGAVARQTFKYNGREDLPVDGVWLWYGINAGTTPDGSPITGTLRDELGYELATVILPPSDDLHKVTNTYMRVPAAKQSRFKKTHSHARANVYGKLSQPVHLVEGETYHMDFTASTGARALISTVVHNGDNIGSFQVPSDDRWDEARAYYKESANAEFEQVGKKYMGSLERDVPTCFTYLGLPEMLG